ncbi:hypothetical protein BJ742DRAFT_673291, partial [Cladochytrium replicatum]
FNADKKKVGMYYSAPIWSFRMKDVTFVVSGSQSCANIHESFDHKNAGYCGGWRETERRELEREDNGTIDLQEKLADPFYRLEHAVFFKKRVEDSKPIITELQLRNDRAWKDPCTKSQILRKKFRVCEQYVTLNIM